jgi:hypothetical protein
MRRLRLGVSGLFLLVGAACDDGFGPQVWADTPDTLTIYSITRAELLGRPSGIDIASGRPRTVVLESALESTASWDFALTESAGTFQLMPASTVAGLESRAGIVEVPQSTLDEVLQAPGDSDAFLQTPLDLEIGQVYVLRSRRAQCNAFQQGVFYGKMKALALDAASGAFKFEIVRNPYCNNRALIPPEDDD